MLTRKWLLTTVLCGGLFAAGGMGATAFGASGALMKPNSAWTVSKLSASQVGGQPYCALARRFTNNFVFTLARNGQDESSVAIDFQRQALNNTQTYHVTLAPGFGQDRSFNVRPVSGKALVIRLGQDYAFHDALNRSGKLEVSLSGENYIFDLADFADGQKKLSECLVNIIEPAAGPVSAAEPAPVIAAAEITPPPAPAPVQRSIIPVSAEAPPPAVPAQAPVQSVDNSGIARQIDNLQEENARLRGALERERRMYEDRFMQESETSSIAAELREKVRLLEMENGQLRDQVSYKPAAEAQTCTAPDTAATDDLNLQLQQLQEENARLRQSVTVQAELERQLSQAKAENLQLKTSGNVSEALEQQVVALQMENERLRGATTQTASSLEGRLRELETENLTLKQDLAAQQARSAALEKQLADNNVSGAEANMVEGLKSRIARLEQDNEALKQKNEMMAKDGADVPVSLAQLRSVEEQLRYVEADRNKLLQEVEQMGQAQREGRLDISTDNWNLEQATRRFNEAEREIQRLARQLEEQRTQCASNVKKLEYMLFDPKVAEEEQIARLIKLEEEVNSAQDVLDEQKAAYEDKLAKIQQQASAHQQQMDVLKAEYEQKLAVVKEELASRGGGAGSAAQVAALQSELSALKQQASAAETTIKIQKAEYEQKLALVKQEQDSRGNGLQEARARIAQLEQELADKGTFSADTKQRMAKLESDLQSRIAIAESAQQRIAALESEVQAKTKLAIDAQSKVAALETQLASSQQLTDKARQQIAMLETDLQNARSAGMEVGAVQKQRDELARQKTALESENQRLSGQIASLQSQIGQLQTLTDGTQQKDDRIAALLKNNETLNSQNQQLSTQITALETQLADIQTAAGDSKQDQARIAALLDDKQKLIAERDRLAAEQRTLTQKVASLEKALSEIKTSSGTAEFLGAAARVPAVAPVSAAPAVIHASATAESYEDAYQNFGASVQKTVEPAVTASRSALTASMLKSVLDQAHVPVQGAVEKAADVSGADFVAYSWDTGMLFGSAEQQPMGNVAQFDGMVDDYIAKTRTRCGGDFAAVPVVSREKGSMRVSAYEIACVQGSDGASASVVFYNQNGAFTAIAHETGLDGMGEAMDVRDRLVSTLIDSQVVSR